MDKQLVWVLDMLLYGTVTAIMYNSDAEIALKLAFRVIIATSIISISPSSYTFHPTRVHVIKVQ